ncbi:hypothetical protein H6P81_016574 [Aristolochia fimbriata]|uniref:TPX2 C-terminal domain-containing protein n=1 Tax=Aristolochia fimbriata TaxID=158543 RepID=A0AAV7E936_ARIFI|nr:hypothetical protein H6P81_016574 [Aristolochia fimbriata]
MIAPMDSDWLRRCSCDGLVTEILASCYLAFDAMDMPNIAVPESGNFTDHVEGTATSPGKENGQVKYVADAVEVNGSSDGSSNKSSYGEVVSPVAASDSRKANVSKKLGAERGDHVKIAKMPTNQTERKVLPTVARKQGKGLSKSLSLPSKGNLANGLRKSTERTQQSSANTSSGSINLTSRLDNPSRRAFAGVTSVDSLKALARSKSSTAIPSSANRRSQSGKRGSVNVNIRSLASDTPQNGTSHVLRKSSGSDFAFRSDERAQKRKEFNLKLEEKTQAKEAEKNNLQAKTKEDQEAEIRHLRRSLAFKAKAMPTFYHEPPPQKGEVKKIPTTRPKSPKLGRHKPSMSLVENTTDRVSGSRHAVPKQGSSKQHGASLNGNGDETATVVKSSTRRSLSKLPSPKESSTKQDAKPFQQNPKMADRNRKVENADKSETSENHESREDSPPVAESLTDLDSFQDGVGYDDTILNLPDPPDEVSPK